MARIARLVVPGFPHHVTQRGVRKQQTFFDQRDYAYYIDLIAEVKVKAGCDVWAYCLMPNHVHFVIVPEHKNSLAMLFKEVHRRYTRRINLRQGCQGHLWQERFHSFIMDEPHLCATVRYVELNPVEAGLCQRPQEWRWSSIHAHLEHSDDIVTSHAPMTNRYPDWFAYVNRGQSEESMHLYRLHGRTGRPLGSESFVENLEKLTNRQLKVKKRGRKIKK